MLPNIKLASSLGKMAARTKHADDMDLEDDEDPRIRKKKPSGGMMDYLPAALGVGAAGAAGYGAHQMGWLNGLGLDRLGIPDVGTGAPDVGGAGGMGGAPTPPLNLAALAQNKLGPTVGEQPGISKLPLDPSVPDMRDPSRAAPANLGRGPSHPSKPIHMLNTQGL